MGPIVSSIFLLSVSLLSQVTISYGNGLSRRFFLSDLLVDKLVPSHFKLQECILCICYQECHSEQFAVDEDLLCKDYVNTIKCSEIDRCSCCNDLTLDNYKPCQNNGQCHNLGHGNFTCDCQSGYYGKRCELNGTPPQQQLTDYCANSPCQNGGVCSNGKTGFVCQCSTGWTGQKCEIDACHGSQCGTHGVCQHFATSPFYHCNCSQGYFGQHCEYNFCNVKHCNNGGSCLPLDNHPFFRCICASGYTGETCDVALMKPAWTQWFYGACSVTCGDGKVIRIRKCSTGNDGDCAGSSMETTTCTEKSC